ncbi:MAG: sulfotransferase domain-containing protein [Phycisphaerales bacterium]
MGWKEHVPDWAIRNRYLRRFWQMVRVAQGHKFARQHTFFDDDIFLVSYPKSGNTWTRFLVANLMNPNEDVSFTNIERLVPEIYLNYDAQLLGLPRPRVFKSHDPYDPRYRRAVCIVRDPRDVAVSYFTYAKKIKKVAPDAGFDEYMERFMSGTIDAFGSWGENVGSWLGARMGTDGFFVVRYEDLLADGHAQMVRLASFLGIDATDELVSRAIEQSSIDRMRSLEKTQQSDWKMTKHSDTSVSFFRSGQSGGWKDDLPEKWVDEIWSAWGDTMTELGYSREGLGAGEPE